MQHLAELELLQLPLGQYAIFGSGPMAIRGIRASKDLDIIVKKELWHELIQKYPKNIFSNPTCLRIDNIEIFPQWLQLSNQIDIMIDSADMIEELPFVQLKYVLEWKKQFGREKDLKDIELIEKYLSKRNK